MRQTVKNILGRSSLYHPLRNSWRMHKQKAEVRQWEVRGRPCPPPHLVKQGVLKAYAQEYDLRIFVETGTYLGDMVEAMKRSFERIYSIELSEELFLAARERFSRDKHVQIIHGDSARELGKIVQGINQPALFWLDGHYSAGVTARGQKETPILEELHGILHEVKLKHVVIIDDARCFGAAEGYPTIEELIEFIQCQRADYSVAVEDDIIRATPTRP